MLTFEELIEIMGGDPDEEIVCDDGFVMSWGKIDLEEAENVDN